MQRAKLEIALKLYTWMSGDTLHFFPKSKLSFRPWRLLNSRQTSVKSTQSISISEDSQPAIYHYPCTTWDCLLMAVGNGSQVPIFVFFFEGLFCGDVFLLQLGLQRIIAFFIHSICLPFFPGVAEPWLSTRKEAMRGYYQIIFPPHCNIDLCPKMF